MTASLYKLSIPTPCKEDWNTMTPQGNGRHCASCNKVVTDFSVMTDEAIQQFVRNNWGKEMCGRFRNSQLSRITIHIPRYIFQKKMPLWKKYMLVLLICFGKDLFPVDIVFGGQQQLYAQTTGVANNVKKNVKKRKKVKYKKTRILKATIFMYGQFTPTEVGYTFPGDPKRKVVCSKIETDSIAAASKRKNDTAYTKASADTKKKKEQPTKPFPKQDMTFITPALMVTRRRNRNRNKLV